MVEMLPYSHWRKSLLIVSGDVAQVNYSKPMFPNEYMPYAVLV
jgi:hypothetical protein